MNNRYGISNIINNKYTSSYNTEVPYKNIKYALSVIENRFMYTF